MVQVHIEGTAKEVREEMAALLSGYAPVHAESVPKTAKKEKPAETETKADAKVATPTAPTVEDVKATITQMLAVEAIGKPGVIKFFADHYAPAKKASELPAEKYGEFIAKAKELMGV